MTMFKSLLYLSLSAVFFSGCASVGNSSGYLKNARWQKSSANEGEEITLRVSVKFSCPDQSVTFKIWEKDEDTSSDKPFAVITAPIEYGKAVAKWIYNAEDDSNHSRTEIPEFFFVAFCDSDGEARSELIQISAVMNVEIMDDNGKPVKNEKFRIIAPDGKVYYGKTDEHGKCEFSGLIPGLKYKISTE